MKKASGKKHMGMHPMETDAFLGRGPGTSGKAKMEGDKSPEGKIKGFGKGKSDGMTLKEGGKEQGAKMTKPKAKKKPMKKGKKC